jgi:hypothetical protein
LTGPAGATGAQGAVGFGQDGTDGEDSLVPGPAGVGPQGGTGAQGPPGSFGIDGLDGEDSFMLGPPGVAGRDAGLKYTYNNSTALADPGTGKLSFDSTTFASIAALRISKTDGDSNAIGPFIATWDDSVNPIHGTLTFLKDGAPSNMLVLQITGSILDLGVFDNMGVAFVATSGTFVNGDVLKVFFSRTGDQGITGVQGPPGPIGTSLSIPVDDAAEEMWPQIPSGSVLGLGVPTRVAFWVTPTTLGSDPAFLWNPVGFGVNSLVLSVAGTSQTLQVGQGTTGTDIATINVQSGSGAGAAPKVVLYRNTTAGAQWDFDGTDTDFVYTGILKFRAPLSTAPIVAQLSQGGNFTAVGNAHNFGTAGTSVTLTVGAGGAGINDSQIAINAGATGIAGLVLQNNGVSHVQFATAGTNTVLDYVGTLSLRTGVAGPTVAVFSAAGLISTYNSITTVSNGVPAEYATVDLTAQTAAKAATTLYAVPAAAGGMYRISGYAKVTTAATSSTLGGATGLVITFTDNTDSVAQSVTAGGFLQSGNPIVAGTNNTGNTTTTVSYFPSIIVWAKASTNIQYAFGYTSVAAATMQYELHLKLEAM